MKEDFNFFYRLRVRYSEIDGQGIVFNAHYLTYADVAVTEYFRHIGLDYAQMAAENMMDMALVKSTLEFKSSAFFDDILEIGVRTSRIGNKSFTMVLEIYRENSDEAIASIESVYVSYDMEKRTSEDLPEFFIDKVKELEKAKEE